MKTTLILTASALAIAVTGLASAQPAPDAPRGEYAREHGDAPQAGRRHREGGHHRGGRGAMRALMALGAADANGDNQVTRAERDALRAEEFDFRDRNADGYLDAQDASPTRQRFAEMREEAGAEREGGRGRAGRMAAVDADGDGRISRAEFTGAPSPMFDALDANSDGVVTGAEIDARLAERREGRESRWEGRREAMAERRAAAAWWRD
ncbi:hypothetical protein ACWCOP_03980 [Maricaulaceae bacterium MS644]